MDDLRGYSRDRDERSKAMMGKPVGRVLGSEGSRFVSTPADHMNPWQEALQTGIREEPFTLDTGGQMRGDRRIFGGVEGVVGEGKGKRRETRQQADGPEQLLCLFFFGMCGESNSVDFLPSTGCCRSQKHTHTHAFSSCLMENNGDEYFSDDGFDFLPPSTLLQLEQDAIARRTAQQIAQSEKSNLATRNGATRQSAYGGGTSTLKLPQHLHTEFTGEYGALDVGELDAEVLDGDDQSVVALEEAPPAFASRTVFQQYHTLGHIQRDDSHSAVPPNSAEQRGHGDADRMEIEDEDNSRLTADRGALHPGLHGSNEQMQGLATRIEEVRCSTLISCLV